MDLVVGRRRYEASLPDQAGLYYCDATAESLRDEAAAAAVVVADSVEVAVVLKAAGIAVAAGDVGFVVLAAAG